MMIVVLVFGDCTHLVITVKDKDGRSSERDPDGQGAS